MPRVVKLVNGKVQFLEESENLTWEQRFKAALRDTRRAGVKVRQNIRQCCRGCVSSEQLGLPDDESVPYVWTFAGQGSAYRWNSVGEPIHYTERRWGPSDPRVEHIYFNHGGPGTEGARALVEAMTAHGIHVEWDGTEYKCPEIWTPYGLELEAARSKKEKRSSQKAVQPA